MSKKDTFDPHNQTISEIFSIDGIYKIPNYQRQYAWTTEELENLWTDLYEAYQNKTEGNDCYFLGSIVVVNDGKGFYELIDGQQRITTLMIMMNVLLKNFPNINKGNEEDIFVADVEKIESCIKFQGKRNRLQLQTDPKYDSLFKEVIINKETFADLKEPTKKELKLDDPQYKYINSAIFFYNKFKELDENDMNQFVNYIFFSTNIIKIECSNQSFAIKLFQVLNDRGLDLSPSDIVKSYIIGKYEQDDENGKQVFNNNWKNIESLANEYEFKIDDFIIYYEYYKLKSNPRKQVVDELREIIKKANIEELVDELQSFSKSLRKVYESNNPTILSLRYIPWKAYVMTALTSAYQVDYPKKEELFKIIMRFFYISFIAGCTLTQIKQSSFNLIAMIADKKNIDDIEEMLEKTILQRRMYQKVYESLENDVFGEKFLKPVLLSLEYMNRETMDNSFYQIDNTLHVDHILPQKYKNEKAWDYIKNEEADRLLNTLGNMALLQNIKNETALNYGFDKKVRIYKGEDENGINKYGITSFNFTRKIIEDYDKGETKWDIEQIENRKEMLIEAIEEMLDFSKEDLDRKYINEESNTRNGKSKWKYKDVYYDNAKLVRTLIKEYIIKNDIKTLEDIPEKIRNFKMYHHELIISADNEMAKKFRYTKVDANGWELNVRRVCLEENTNEFLNMMKEYIDFELERVFKEEK